MRRGAKGLACTHPATRVHTATKAINHLGDEVIKLYRFLRRLHEAGQLSREEFWSEHEAEVQRLAALHRDDPGGDYDRTQPARVGRRFAEAILIDTLEGRTLYRDAFRLLDIRRTSTFNELARRLGIDA